MSSPIGILIIAIRITISGFGGYWSINKIQRTTQVACTLEARIRPDGSTVERVGPQCELAPCPATTSTNGDETSSGIKGTVILGSTVRSSVYHQIQLAQINPIKHS